MKGFLSFALVLAMVVCLLWMGIAAGKSAFELEKTKNELIKAEVANKERALLENGVDRIVITTLEEQIMLGNYNVQIARNEINSALASYLRGKAYAGNIFNEKIGEATTQYLNDNTSVQILKTDRIIYAEYAYTSGIMKNNSVEAKLGNKIISYFKIPIGYTQKEIKVI